MELSASHHEKTIHKDRLKGKKLIIPVFVPHMGCPHDCCFCNQRLISGQKNVPIAGDVQDVIASYLPVADHYGSVEVAFYGGSFTAIPAGQQKAYLQAARDILGDRDVPFRVSTRPDCIDEAALALLRDYGVTTVELGAQSMCDEVLKASGRGHLSRDTVEASRLLRQEGFVLGIQTMLGLPGSSVLSDQETARRVIDLKPSLVRIYPTVVLAGTALASMCAEGRYQPMDLETAVDLSARLVCAYEESGIKVIRVGLQSSDTISPDGQMIAGPYHPAFGEMVRSRIVGTELTKILDGLFSGKDRPSDFCRQLSIDGNCVTITFNGAGLCIQVPERAVSRFVGHRRRNVIIWGEQYGCPVRIVGNGDLC